jgi:hypothetical protein
MKGGDYMKELDKELWQFTVISDRIIGQTDSRVSANNMAQAFNGVTAIAVWAPTLFNGVCGPGEVITPLAPTKGV